MANVQHENEESETHTDDALAFVLQATPGVPWDGRAAVLEVAQVWEQLVIETRQFPREPRDITIGERAGWRWTLLGVDMGFVHAHLRFVLPYLPPGWSEVTQQWRSEFYSPSRNLPAKAEHTLFRAESDGYRAHVPASWDAFVELDDRRYTLDELAHVGLATRSDEGFVVPLSAATRLVTGKDGIVFFAQLAHPVRRLVARGTGQTDGAFTAVLGCAGFVFLLLMLMLQFAVPTRANDTLGAESRIVELFLQTPPPVIHAPKSDPDAGEGKRAKDDEGKVGEKKAQAKTARSSRLKAPKDDKQIATDSGLIEALENGSFKAIFGPSGLSSELKAGIGGLIGSVGTQIGTGGLGQRSGGLGGGGPTEGIGGLGTKGIGGGRLGHGAEGGDPGVKGTGGLDGLGGNPTIMGGGLDRSLIDEVIKRHLSQIRYCYQRQLSQDPTLEGKVVMQFVIAKSGAVSTAFPKPTTLGNAAVEQCIVQRFLRMQFPEPRGGGIVIVRYPFLFSPG